MEADTIGTSRVGLDRHVHEVDRFGRVGTAITFSHLLGWQLLEERVDTSWSSGFAVDQVYQNIFGLRYIDDVICRRLDANADGDFADANMSFPEPMIAG